MLPKLTGRFRLITLGVVPAVVLAAVALAPATPRSTPGDCDEVAAPAAPAAPAVVATAPAPAPEPPPPPPRPERGRSRDRAERRESSRAWLGVVLSGEDGTRIASVAEDSPASEAGLRRGDRILDIDGKEIEEGDDIIQTMRDLSPGDRVKLTVRRAGEEKTLSVTLGERPVMRRHEFHFQTPEEEEENEGDSGDGGKEVFIYAPSRNFLGVEILGMSEELREAMRAPRDHGVLVNRVVEGSPASEAGLRAGDVIVSVGGETVEDAGDIRRALRDRDAGEEVAVKVVRDGSEKTLDVKVGRRPGASGRRRGGFHPDFRFNYDWKGLSEEEQKEIQRSVDEAMKQVHEAMRKVHEQMMQNGEQMRQIQQEIRDQIRKQMEGLRTTMRARNVYDI